MHKPAPSGIPELSGFPRVELGHYPTPLEPAARLSGLYPPHRIHIKRDDCTGLAFGGNKVRQLEYYLGHALSTGCDAVLSTGAVQSNYMRTLAAAAGKLGLECHIQLEDRVSGKSDLYHRSGNRLLTELFGAHITYCPDGEDEDGADRMVREIAARLEAAGRKPYVVPLKPTRRPIGALGYIEAAGELRSQWMDQALEPDLVVVGSGSGITHAGLLSGLRLLGCDVPVMGACVRRNAELQGPRIRAHCERLCDMLGTPGLVKADDVWVSDHAFAPGYGQPTGRIRNIIETAARLEGLLVDPVYSGKALACLTGQLEEGLLSDYRTVIFVHTGGTPALFAYQDDMPAGPGPGR